MNVKPSGQRKQRCGRCVEKSGDSKSEGEQPAVQVEETSAEVKADEDCKMEVDREAESRTKLDQRKGTLPCSCARSKKTHRSG